MELSSSSTLVGKLFGSIQKMSSDFKKLNNFLCSEIANAMIVQSTNWIHSFCYWSTLIENLSFPLKMFCIVQLASLNHIMHVVGRGIEFHCRFLNLPCFENRNGFWCAEMCFYDPNNKQTIMTSHRLALHSLSHICLICELYTWYNLLEFLLNIHNMRTMPANSI